MTPKEAKRLKIGDRVQLWAGSPDAAAGTVIETGYSAVKVHWDDGQVGVIHLNDTADLTRFHGDAP